MNGKRTSYVGLGRSYSPTRGEKRLIGLDSGEREIQHELRMNKLCRTERSLQSNKRSEEACWVGLWRMESPTYAENNQAM